MRQGFQPLADAGFARMNQPCFLTGVWGGSPGSLDISGMFHKPFSRTLRLLQRLFD
jgi:hypothetical protein